MRPTVGGYELLDAGVRRRLERFGALTIDRPAPGADGFRLAPELWAAADLRFDAGAGWSGPALPTEPSADPTVVGPDPGRDRIRGLAVTLDPVRDQTDTKQGRSGGFAVAEDPGRDRDDVTPSDSDPERDRDDGTPQRPSADHRGPPEPGHWRVEIDGLTMELRPTASGGVGLYPEHAANLDWLAAQVAARAEAQAATEAGPDAGSAAAKAPQVLNLFAHTGLATLALARAGAAVAHVDGARSAVAWARANAALSGLADRPIRWLVDDAAGFVAREARRGRRYDGIVLDPPAFGRAPGREWRLEDDLPALLAACRSIAANGAFVLLTAHSEAIDGTRLAEMLHATFGARGRAVSVAPLDLTATSGATLALGWAARLGA